jgi:hypothetical protein
VSSSLAAKATQGAAGRGTSAWIKHQWLHADVVAFIRDRKLHGQGVGWIDVHLLASALVARLEPWTTDPELATVAKEIGLSYD